MDVGEAGGLLDGSLIVGVRGEGDVIPNGIAEQEIILGDVSGVLADGADGEIVDVVAVQEDGAVGDVVGAEKQIHQGGLARSGLADDTHVLAGVDLEGYVREGIVGAAGVTEGEVAHFNITRQRRIGLSHGGLVRHVHGGVQKRTDTGEGGFSARPHLNELGDSHDGPDDGGEIADEFHQLTCIELTVVDQIAAVAQDDADHRFHEQGHQNVEQSRDLGEFHVDLFILLVELAEGHELNRLLDEGLDDGDARKVLLGEIRQSREGLLPLVPFLLHVVPHDGADDQQKGHGDEGKEGKGEVHAEHLEEGHDTQEQGVGQHEDSRAEAVLYCLQVVGEVGHEGTHLVDLVILAGKILTAVEHPPAQVGLYLDARAKEADTPEEPPEGHADDDEDHGQADGVQQKVHVKDLFRLSDSDEAVLDAVDDHTVQLGNLELHDVDHHQGQNAQQQRRQMLQIVSVDMLPEYQGITSFHRDWGASPEKARNPQFIHYITL